MLERGEWSLDRASDRSIWGPPPPVKSSTIFMMEINWWWFGGKDTSTNSNRFPTHNPEYCQRRNWKLRDFQKWWHRHQFLQCFIDGTIVHHTVDSNCQHWHWMVSNSVNIMNSQLQCPCYLDFPPWSTDPDPLLANCTKIRIAAKATFSFRHKSGQWQVDIVSKTKRRHWWRWWGVTTLRLNYLLRTSFELQV